MTMRAGYKLTLPGGTVVTDSGNHNDASKWARQMMMVYGTKIEWGPVVKYPRKRKFKAF